MSHLESIRLRGVRQNNLQGIDLDLPLGKLIVVTGLSGALARTRDSLQGALLKLQNRAPAELMASDLKQALESLGEIIGRVDNEAMLDRLFATFCIGK